MFEMKQLATSLEVPLNADTVDSPVVRYGERMTAIHFVTEDGRWGRVTFENLDSIKISRGEYEPFPSAPGEENVFSWVTTISNSAWLRERYKYEKRHYGSAYNFGGNVDEMLTDFSHYVFSFHDQFVEVLAAGIWFESADSMLEDSELQYGHPLNGLAHLEPAERFEHAGITCQVRRNPLSTDEIQKGARLCSQPILEVAAELDGGVGTHWSVTHRMRNGLGTTSLRGYFGNSARKFDSIPDLKSIRSTIDPWLEEVGKRRKAMGKT